MFCTEPLNITFSPDIIPCWPLYNYQLLLHFAASTFRVHEVQNLKLSTIHTKYRKTRILTNSAVPICAAASPLSTVRSVPDTRTNFTYRCSFNWKRNTNGTFVLSIITSALNADELLGSRPGPFIPGEEWQYKLTRRMCGPQSQSGRFGNHRKHLPLPEFETCDRPAHSIFHRLNARLSSRNLILRNLVT